MACNARKGTKSVRNVATYLRSRLPAPQHRDVTREVTTLDDMEVLRARHPVIERSETGLGERVATTGHLRVSNPGQAARQHQGGNHGHASFAHHLLFPKPDARFRPGR